MRKMKLRTGLVWLAVVLGVALSLCRTLSSGQPKAEGTTPDVETPARRPIASTESARADRPDDAVPEAEDVGSEEDMAEAAETAAVEAFDALTDKWMEPAAAKVDLKAIAAFGEAFRKVPAARRDECIHRALNLIPDENVMLLAGVLMDKSMPKEIVETVFNDILNRDEDVKKPILQEIFRDKTHPCWTDTAWILDVTGELPDKSQIRRNGDAGH